MQRKYLSLIAALAVALPAVSQAELNYSFVELKRLETEIDIDDFDIEGDGFAVRGSLAVHPNFFAFAQLSELDYDFGVDGESWMIGGGGHWPLNPSWDVVAKLALVNEELSGEDDSALTVSGGVRGLVTQQIEVDAALEYSDIDEPFEGLYLVGEGRYNFNDQWAAGVFLRLGDDLTTYGISGRFSF